MPDETAHPPSTDGQPPPDHAAAADPSAAAQAWSTEYYGPVSPPGAEALPRPAAPPTAPTTAELAKPWWNRGRTLAAAAVAAAIFAVGALGFSVGHAAADGPHQTGGTSDVGRGPGGPDNRDFGH